MNKEKHAIELILVKSYKEGLVFHVAKTIIDVKNHSLVQGVFRLASGAIKAYKRFAYPETGKVKPYYTN